MKPYSIVWGLFRHPPLLQSIYDAKGKMFFERKLKEGKTKRQARKCLARQLCNIVFKTLKEMQQINDRYDKSSQKQTDKQIKILK